MRSLFAIVMLLSAEGELPPGDLLQRGVDRFRAAQYAEASSDLAAAAQGFLSPEKMQAYVTTGRFDDLGRFETALVYLALAHSRSGRDDDARGAILRLATAERIAPAYAALSLPSADASEFETLARRLVPNLDLGGHGVSPPAAIAEAQPVPLPPPPPTPPTPGPAVAVPAPVALAPAVAVTERQLVRDEMISQEIARIEREAEARIAAVQREADARIAELERIIAERQRPALPPMTPREYLVALRDATTLAATGHADEANFAFRRIARAEAPREIVAEAAVGLYRTGAFRDAAEAFQRLGVFRRGEEDLRYYAAVSYFETGRYADARHELACALPFIEVTDDVSRYRTRIEQTFR